MLTWADKLAVLWKGPSWLPGLPRLDSNKFKIKVKDKIMSHVIYKLCLIINFKPTKKFQYSVFLAYIFFYLILGKTQSRV